MRSKFVASEKSIDVTLSHSAKAYALISTTLLSMTIVVATPQHCELPLSE
tara:strand:- start:193 stop:342 length:150 start_codon:yes stop_codon:yes gene_type:complete